MDIKTPAPDPRVKIEGDNLILTIPLNKEGKVSTSGKNILHHTSNIRTLVPEQFYNGKPLTIGVNVYSKNPERGKK